MPEQIVRRCIECDGLCVEDDWTVVGMLIVHKRCLPAGSSTVKEEP